jgi:hypothetical protein|tara:strand:- start:1148 stop:1369 length:222 start_codon:yes stop_codon:yes gene_type:complete
MSEKTKSRIEKFLNDFRELLDKNNTKIISYGSDIEIYINDLGHIGFLEDHEEYLEINDGENILYKSKAKKPLM